MTRRRSDDITVLEFCPGAKTLFAEEPPLVKLSADCGSSACSKPAKLPQASANVRRELELSEDFPVVLLRKRLL